MKIKHLFTFGILGFILLVILAFSKINASSNNTNIELPKCCKAYELSIQIDNCQAHIIRNRMQYSKDGDEIVKDLERKIDSLKSEINSLNIPTNISVVDCCFKSICSNFRRPNDDELFTLMLHIIREYSSMISRSSDFYTNKTKDGMYRVGHNKKHVNLQFDDFKRFEKAIIHVDSVYSRKLLNKRNEIFSKLNVNYSRYTELHYEIIYGYYAKPENYPLLNNHSVLMSQDFYLGYVQQKDSVYNLFIR